MHDARALMPPPASQNVNPRALCPVSSFPSSGVSPGRPNSPPQTTNVSSSRPRSRRSSSKAAIGRVGRLAVGLQIAAVILVLIPTAVIDFDESHAGLGKSPSQQTLPSKIGRSAGANLLLILSDAVSIERRLRFVAQDPATPAHASAFENQAPSSRSRFPAAIAVSLGEMLLDSSSARNPVGVVGHAAENARFVTLLIVAADMSSPLTPIGVPL